MATDKFVEEVFTDVVLLPSEDSDKCKLCWLLKE